MADGWLVRMLRLGVIAHVTAVVGCGLMAGLLFAFSVSVLPALGRLPAPQGIAAMQSINAVIQNPVFVLVFFGTAASCLLLVVTTLSSDQPGTAARLVGALLFVVGTFLVTVVCNVPLNNALDKVDPASAAGAEVWAHYRTAWVAWNNVRTLAATAATVVLALSLR